MTTYTLPAVRITYDTGIPIAATAATSVRFVVPDGVNAFSYDIVRSFDNAVPIVSLETQLYNLQSDTGPFPFSQTGSFELGYLISGTGEGADSAAILTVTPQGSRVGADPIFYFIQLAGDPIPDGSNLFDFLDWADELSEAGEITTGDLKVGDLIPFEAVSGATRTEDDVIFGTAAADTYLAGIGDDVIIGGRGDDQIDGGAGMDTAVVTSAQSSYTLSLTAAGAVLRDRTEDGTGEDQMISIETIDFGAVVGGPEAQSFNLGAFDGGTGLGSDALKEIVELYIAYFNRAPDAVGLNFWATQYAEGLSLDAMAGFFFDQPETRAIYDAVLDGASNLTDAPAFVTQVYNNVLGRVPDQAGFDFWVTTLQTAPDITPANFILAVLQGAKDPANPTPGHAVDQAFLINKTELGAYFSVTLGMSDVTNATTVMSTFAGTEASFAAAREATDGFYAAALDPVDGEFLMPLVGVLDDGIL